MICTADFGGAHRSSASADRLGGAPIRIRRRRMLAQIAIGIILGRASTEAATFAPISGELGVRVGSQSLTTIPVTYGMTSLQDDVFQGGGLNLASASLTANVDGDRFVFRSAAGSSTSSPQSPEEAGLTSWAESSGEFSQPFTTSVARRVTLSSRVDRSADQTQVRAAISVESQGGLKSLNLSDTGGLTEVSSLIFPPGQHLIEGAIFTSTISNSAGPLTGRLSGDFSVGPEDDYGFVLVTAEADLDADLLVGVSDLNIWSAGFGMTQGAGFADGDVNEDRAVNGADFLTWQRQYGPVASIAVAGLPVPEPNAWGLFLMGATAAAIVHLAHLPRRHGDV